MKIQGIGAYLLIALVQSKMEPSKPELSECKLKFTDFDPEPKRARAKKKYKK